MMRHFNITVRNRFGPLAETEGTGPTTDQSTQAIEDAGKRGLHDFLEEPPVADPVSLGTGDAADGQVSCNATLKAYFCSNRRKPKHKRLIALSRCACPFHLARADDQKCVSVFDEHFCEDALGHWQYCYNW